MERSDNVTKWLSVQIIKMFTPTPTTAWEAECDISVSKLLGFETLGFGKFGLEKKYRFRIVWSPKKSFGFGKFVTGKKKSE